MWTLAGASLGAALSMLLGLLALWNKACCSRHSSWHLTCCTCGLFGSLTITVLLSLATYAFYLMSLFCKIIGLLRWEILVVGAELCGTEAIWWKLLSTTWNSDLSRWGLCWCKSCRVQQTVQCLAAFGTTTSDHSSCKLGESETLEDQRATDLSGGVAQMQSRCDKDAKGSLSGFIDPVFTDFFILHLILGIFRRQSSNMFVQPYVLQIRKLLKDCRGIWALPGWALTSSQLVGWCWSRLSPRDRLTDLHGAILEPVLYWGPVKFPGRLVRKTWHFVSYLLQISKLWPHGVLSLKMVYRRVKQLGLRLSSGSTGVPKCIQIAHGGATACCRFQSIELNL